MAWQIVGFILLGLTLYAFAFVDASVGIQAGGVLLVLTALCFLFGEFARRAGLKKCPKCAEEVKAEAVLCRYCQHRF